MQDVEPALPLIDVIGRLASDASHALETKIHIDALDSFPFTGKDQLRLAQFQPETGRPFGTNQAVSLIEIVQAVPP